MYYIYILYQYFTHGIQLSITSGTKEQAVKIWQDKHREVLNFYPSLKNEIVKVSFSKDDGTVIFKNGSRVTSLPINQA